MYESLRDFVSALSSAGELARIDAPVSPLLEIAAITDRVSKSPAPRPPSPSAQRNDPRHHHLGGKALLFTRVHGSDIPVLINAYGSYRRTEMALGCDDRSHTPGGFDALAQKIGELVKPEPPRSLAEALAKARQFAPLLRIPPKRRRGMGPCQEVILTGDDVDLRRLPIIKCWPHDGDFAALGYPPDVNDNIPGVDTSPEFRGRYITLAGIHTIHADDHGNPKPSSHNIGMYRVQMLGPRRMAMHWHMHHDGARHWRSWKARAEPMPVAIVLGGESILPYAATAPLPPGISELLLAGFLNRRGIPMCRARTVPLWIPSNAEIVIEGYVSHEAGPIGYDPRRDGPLGPGAVFEGPFGDHTGFYSLPDRYPILDVTAITMRRDPIYPTTIVGLPPQEDYYLGKATERLFLPLLKTLIHDIEDYDLPMFGAFHNCAFVKINKSYPLQARRVMHSIWGAGQMAWTKTIFVVDHDVDVHDTHAVLRAAGEHCDPERDIELVNGPLDILDHAAPRLGAGTKIGFDCTRKWPGEEVKGIQLTPPPRPGVGSVQNPSPPPLGRGQGGGTPSAPDTSPHPTPPPLPGVGRGPGGGTPLAHTPAARSNPSPPGGGGEDSLDAPASRQVRASLLPTIRAIPTITAATLHADHWLLIAINKAAPRQGRQTIDAIINLNLDLPPFIIIVGPDADLANIDDALFHWPAHSDAGRDAVLHPARADHDPVAALEPRRRPTLFFDATPKLPGDEAASTTITPPSAPHPVRDWPPILKFDQLTLAHIAAQWPSYKL